MRVLLILAGRAEFKVEHASRFSIPIMSPPLTLLLLGEVCRRAGFDAELIDTRLFMKPSGGRWVLREEELEAAIAQSAADVAGVSFLSSSAEDGYKVASMCAKHGKTVVCGGLHASVAPREVIDSGAFHYILQGEGEVEFPRLLKELESKTRERFPKTAILLRAEMLRDLSVVPAITDYSVYDPVIEQYGGEGRRSFYVETTRGCFKECSFCEVAKTGAAWSPLRKVPLETVLRSVEHAVRDRGADYLLVADSIATVHFASRMSEDYAGVTVQLNSTVDCWDRERASACGKLRCSVWFGFESGSQRILDEVIVKGATVAQAHDAARLCREHDIPCAFNVLLGLPGETEEDYLRTVEVFEKCPWVYPNPNVFNPLPGTALYERCLRDGLLRDPRDYNVWDASDIAEAGRGPLRGVDYGLVLKYHRVLTQLQGEPQRALA
jgi:anaerobic magnesium-protoporphyrin IX monomethyl ester cyclase